MKIFQSIIWTTLLLPLFALGQATSGFHRVSQILARAPQGGVTAQVVPYAKIYVTGTASGVAATIYSDPLLSAVITPPILTADKNGGYSYYIPNNYCVTENISAPGQGNITITNVCSNNGGTGAVNPGTTGQIAYYPGNGSAVSGTNALPNGTTATTQGTCASNTDVATGAYVANCVSASTGSSGTYLALVGTPLQTSITAALAAGYNTITVPESTFTGNVNIPSNFTMLCVSRKSVLTIANNANTDVIDINTGVNNVTIRNCSIAGNGSNQSGSCVSGGGTPICNGIYLAGQNNNITIDNVSINSTHDGGIYQYYANGGSEPTSVFNSNFIVSNSSITNAGQMGIHFADTKGVWLTNDYFYNWGARVSTNDAIQTFGMNYNVHITNPTGVTNDSTYFFMESVGDFSGQGITGFDISGVTTSSVSSSAATGFSGYFFNGAFRIGSMVSPSNSSACAESSGLELVGSNIDFSGGTLVNGAIVLDGVATGAPSNVTIHDVTIKDNCPFDGWYPISFGGGQSAAYTTENVTVHDVIVDLSGTASGHGANSGMSIGWSDGGQGPIHTYDVHDNTIITQPSGSVGVGFGGTSNTITDGKVHDNRIINAAPYAIGLVYGESGTGANINGLTLSDNDVSGSPGAVSLGFASNVLEYGTKLAQSDLLEHFPGNSSVDQTGFGSFPGGVASGNIYSPPLAGVVTIQDPSASNNCTGGGTLATWYDSSGNGYDMASGTVPATCSLNVLNGNAALVFNGTQTGYRVAIPTLTALTSNTSCDVFQKTAGTPATGYSYLVDSYQYPTYSGMYFSTDATLTSFVQNASPQKVNGTIANDGAPHSYCVSTNVTSYPATTVTLYQDFVQIGTLSVAGPLANLSGLFLGAEGNGTNAVTGDFFYHITYNQAMTASMATSLAAYIQNRFGIAQDGAWSIVGGNAKLQSVVTAATGVTPSPSPICPNGTGGAFTTSGCTGGLSTGFISGQATGVIPLPSGATAITAQSHIDDGKTTAGTITSSEPISAPSLNAGLVSTADLEVFALADPTGRPSGTPSSSGGTLTSSSSNFAFIVAVDAAGNQTNYSTNNYPGVITASCGSGPYTCSIAWSWTAVPGASSYQIWGCNTSACSPANYFTSMTNSFTQTSPWSSGTSGTIPSSNTTGKVVLPGTGLLLANAGAPSSYFPVPGEGAAVMTGPATSAAGNCAEFADNVGTLSDAGTACSTGGTIASSSGTSTTAHTFSTAFTATPVCTASPYSNAGSWYFSTLPSMTSGGIITYTTSGAQTFGEICTGPGGFW